MGRSKFEIELLSMYGDVRADIEGRIQEFLSIWEARDEERVLSELKFCLLTPQSKALSCWAAVERLGSEGVCSRTAKEKVEECLKGVRFHHNKAKYLLDAMERFEDEEGGIIALLEGFGSSQEARDWLVGNIKGLGLKEASHFLRNIGLGEDLAILDRHILRNLALAGAIPEVPRSLPRGHYLEIEERMKAFSSKLGVPLSHLDLLLWYKQTGCVFK
ncbi:MAG: N-glycosylase/DNA lyase [Candidatus Thermoplasmatota archaeon]|jgi:N-glycosylase/DNA lyase|nr:N-glycosylase/DNA lyase [Candidatus Thermoplasmatota archaeon]